MSVTVETVTVSKPSTPSHSVQGSTATFGVQSASDMEERGKGKAASALPSSGIVVSNGQGAANGANGATNGSAKVPEVNVNGEALPKAIPRRPKSSTGTVADESAWGANFWVTLIEPQTQTPFYACPATGEVSWDPPVGNFVLPPSAEGEWWELVDESRGLPYYYHTKTNETVWERPDGFVIPLGILQNTSLGRRLSARYSQALDVDIKAADDGERPSYRRTVSTGPLEQSRSPSGLNRKRSQSSTRSATSPSTKPVQQRSASGDQYRGGHHHSYQTRDGHGHGYGHGFGLGTQLPPIPASPYATESSSPPSPDSKRESRAALANLESKDESNKGAVRSKKEKELSTTPVNGSGKANGANGETTPPRSRSKSSSFVPYRSPQPQSLDAAAELIAHYPSGQNSTAAQKPSSQPQSPTSPSISSAPASPTDGHISFAPQASSSPARQIGSLGRSAAPNMTLSISIDRNPLLPGPASAGVGGRFGSLVKGKERDLGPFSVASGFISAAPPSPRNRPPIPSMFDSAHNLTGGVQAPKMARRDTTATTATQTGTIRTQDIGLPQLDAEATWNLSPVKARAEGKPIFLEPRKSYNEADVTRYSIGGRPVLPDDLASDIQQFVQTEFARQYFTTHRTGFIFRRKIPVEKMMVWQKAPLQSPLLVLNRSLQKDAVKVFKVIQRIMGDRERDRPVGVRSASDNHHLNALSSSASSFNASSTSLPSLVTGILEEERWLLTEGLTHGELRDEIYCQLVKQLTGNINTESVFRGWQLLCVLLVTFPPSKNFEAYLRSFINQRILQTEGRVDVMAKYCLQRLSIISRKGPRGKPPTIAEIETASDAAFNPSTFGESLDAVVRLQERTYPHLQVPIILHFLADGILALGGTKSEGIFRIPGDGDSVSELKIRIERGYYNLEGVDDPHVPASLLKLWLRELCDPLVPNELYNDCVACAKEPEQCVAMVSRLPTINRRVVLFVISFLQLFLDEKIQSVTKMTAANLALVMAPNLLRCDSESMTVVFTNAPYEQMFVHNLLLHLKCSKVDPGYTPKHGLGSAIVSPTISRNSKSQKRRVR